MTTSSLTVFLDRFQQSFEPPKPYRGKTGKSWLISGEWTRYLKDWLIRNTKRIKFEQPLPKRRRLDAAIWLDGDPSGLMDIALEWEWDHESVATEYSRGDFRKLMGVDAKCGLAIVHTRADRSDGQEEAERSLMAIRQAYGKFKSDDRPIWIIEIRRTYRDDSRVEFLSSFHDLVTGLMRAGRSWSCTSNP